MKLINIAGQRLRKRATKSDSQNTSQKNTERLSKSKIYEERFMSGLSNILGNGGTRSAQSGIQQMEGIAIKAKKK